MSSHNPACKQVQHGSQIMPTLSRPHIRDVTTAGVIRRIHIELSIQPIRNVNSLDRHRHDFFWFGWQRGYKLVYFLLAHGN